jgi:hypothetical protein
MWESVRVRGGEQSTAVVIWRGQGLGALFVAETQNSAEALSWVLQV